MESSYFAMLTATVRRMAALCAGTLLAAAMLLLVCGTEARANPVNLIVVCNGTNYGPATLVNCPTLGGTAGMVNGAAGTTTGVGTLDNFLTTVTPGTLNTTLGYTGTTGGNPPPPNIIGPITAVANPIWDVPLVTAYLTLNGSIYFPAAYTPASLALTLTGVPLGTYKASTMINGTPGVAGTLANCSNAAQLCISDLFSTTLDPQCIGAWCSFSITVSAPYNTVSPDTEIESLSISTTGGVIYTNDDTYDAAPEPASLALFATGLAGFGLVRRRRARR